MTDVLLVEDVVKVLDSRVILNGVSIRVSSKEIFGLLGPNGSGKTTLMNIVCGILKPDEGRVLVRGMAPKGDDTRSGQSPR